MRLVLDEHWSSEIAVQLRRRDFDVVAATESEHADRYRGIEDEEFFARAQQDERAVVTDNVRDYERIRRGCEERGEVHFGVVFAAPPTFDRRQGALVGPMVRALERFLRSPEAEAEPFNRAHWLRRVGQ